jgi:hypothetical protein
MTFAKLSDIMFATCWTVTGLAMVLVIALLIFQERKTNQCKARGFAYWDLPGGCYNITKTYEAAK